MKARRTRRASRWLLVVGLLGAAVLAPSASAQTRLTDGPRGVEEVGYANPLDGTPLSAALHLPAGSGPHPGVVLLSIAGTTPIVDRLVVDGYAVLVPERRGFVAVEPLLQATYSDLATDVSAALTYLRSRGDVDASSLSLIAQDDDTPAAMMAAAAEPSVPLVLLAPPVLPGVERFKREQRAAAVREGAAPEDLDALDTYIDRIADVVLFESAPYMRRYRLESVRAGSPVELPRNAAFPADEQQMHFFASPLWRDRLAFEPESVMNRLGSRVLVLIGSEDANVTLDEYLPRVRKSLATPEATVCLLPGRTRHVFTEVTVETAAAWVEGRVLDTCLDDEAH